MNGCSLPTACWVVPECARSPGNWQDPRRPLAGSWRVTCQGPADITPSVPRKPRCGARHGRGSRSSWQIGNFTTSRSNGSHGDGVLSRFANAIGEPLRFLPDESKDVGIVLLECGIRSRYAPQRNTDDVDGDFAGDTHQGVPLLDYLPVRARNSVSE